ncbi:MAG: hypothetical protein GXO70_00400 [Acidobacteria bacterium]|nr:hypothetical protein [Acidobacteriota bacterium]
MRSFSAKRQSRVPGWLKGLMIIGIAWSLVGAGMYYRAGAALKSRSSTPATMLHHIHQARYTGFFPLKHRLDEMENVATILAGRKSAIEDSVHLTHETYQVVLRNLLAAHRLDTFSSLMNYLIRQKVSMPRFQGMYYFDQGKFAKAAPFLKQDPAFQSYFVSGSVPVVAGVLDVDMKSGKFRAKLPGTGFLENAVSPHRHFLAIYENSLVPDIQKILYQSMGKWSGAFLVTENDHLIGLCAKNMNPFRDVFEAGSVIKVVTMAAAIEEGVTVDFPYNCKGPIRVGGRIFYDWKKHGELKNMADSLACSCNLVFAETALKLGPEVEGRWLDRFGINNRSFFLGELEARLGEKRAPLAGDYALARGAIGLDTAYITPYWLVRTAASLASDGRDILPTPFTNEIVPGNGTLALQSHSETEPLFPKEALPSIKEGMLNAVNWKNGTGKRAMVPGIKLMLKTGTAGKSPYNSVLMGTFEVGGHRYAFGLFLEKAGRAEFNGTAVLKSALEKLRIKLMIHQRPETARRP